jgi:hypothetical protein
MLAVFADSSRSTGSMKGVKYLLISSKGNHTQQIACTTLSRYCALATTR